MNSFREELGKEYEALKEYCGSLACVMPGASSVESDFSLINWTIDPNLKSFTALSSEAILHCKQCENLGESVYIIIS